MTTLLDYCPLCLEAMDTTPSDDQAIRAWRIEHDMKEHPGYYAYQTEILKWKDPVDRRKN